MFRCIALALLALSVLFTVGCGRAVIVTEVRPGGSFTRELTFHGAKPGGLGDVIKDVFVTPTGAGWTAQEVQNADVDETELVARRTFAAGEATAGDLVVLGGPKANPVPWLRSEATVRKIGARRYEYTETLHWLGKRDDLDDDTDPTVRAELVKLVGSAALVDEIRREILRKMLSTLLGPPKPIVSDLMSHPELVVASVRRDTGREIERLLRERLGDRLTTAQRTDVARRYLDIVMRRVESTRAKATQKKDRAGERTTDPGMVSLTFALKMPGRLVEANGLADELDGTVTWGLFVGAASFGQDMTLRAVFEPAQQP